MGGRKEADTLSSFPNILVASLTEKLRRKQWRKALTRWNPIGTHCGSWDDRSQNPETLLAANGGNVYPSHFMLHWYVAPTMKACPLTCL